MSFFVRNFCAWYTEVADKEIISLIEALWLSRVRRERKPLGFENDYDYKEHDYDHETPSYG